jgi:poly(A) polymerase
MEGLKDLPKDEPVGELPPQDWLEAEETRAVMAALAADGAQPRFVGGCVRDALARRPVKDIDIATPDPPERVVGLLARAHLRSVPTGLVHGTITAIANGRPYEITTLRRDVETDGRHAKVAFTDDWIADAARRDFTINALSCRADRQIYDPFGGIADLAAGRIVFVGDPGKRIDEDVLRLLRYFRFYAHFGHPPADTASLHACRARAGRLIELSGERIAAETMKLLAATDPLPALVLMQWAGVLAALLPDGVDFGRVRALTFLESRGVRHASVAADPLRRLAALLKPDAGRAAELASRLRLSNAQTERLIGLAAPETAPDRLMDPPTQRRLLYRLGAERFVDLTLMAWAQARADDGYLPPGDNGRWMAMLDLAGAWTIPAFPIRGEDVVASGVPAGPEVGRRLASLRDWWEAEDFCPSRAELLERLKRFS